MLYEIKKAFKFKIGMLWAIIAQKKQKSGFHRALNMLLGLNELTYSLP
jgi:hypothetical protein